MRLILFVADLVIIVTFCLILYSVYQSGKEKGKKESETKDEGGDNK